MALFQFSPWLGSAAKSLPQYCTKLTLLLVVEPDIARANFAICVVEIIEQA